MSEWTPTTEDVRGFFIWAALRGAEGRLQGSQEAEEVAVGVAGPYFDRWLAEHDRQVASRAWDEGFDAGEQDAWDAADRPDHECARNPYREETT
ncbi:hypothetical protein JRG19_02475 [Pseudoclavibacter alba]|uniref:hypothetical protein n=1 Tax=Pseudoclavibacter albus TaxID=272241 RepID=UPI0019D0E099|nr:hypothetical protein [Pseudoclavibacter alba]MBN6777416.1 hypothetical protein [Pseudoclavibacter alba]